MPEFLDLWVIIWVVLVIGTIVVEAMSAELTSIWFTVGAFVALVAKLFGAGPVLQVIIFVVVSAACLILTRPLVKKIVNQKKSHFNADKVIGASVIVTKQITPDEIGEVRAETVLWRAITVDGSTIEVGEKCTAIEIRGTKLVVKKEN